MIEISTWSVMGESVLQRLGKHAANRKDWPVCPITEEDSDNWCGMTMAKDYKYMYYL